jgi:hypothetical protein
MDGNKKTPKNADFSCILCNFSCSKNSEWVRHTKTIKHTHRLDGNKNGMDLAPKNAKNICEYCTKEYSTISGLWKHKHKCALNKPQEDNSKSNDLKNKTEELINYLIKENAEFKQLIIDQNKQMFDLAKIAGHHNNNTTNNNFNLQFFLNETCKDALNIMDFVSQLQIGMKDLEETGRLGFVEGISKIFINGLKELDVSNRPVHCSDSKRETIYIKDDNQWHKESDDKIILTNALKKVVHKNMKQIPEWTKEHPEYNDYASKENDKYLKIVSQSMPGTTTEETNKNYNKIIKNIAKQTIIK